MSNIDKSNNQKADTAKTSKLGKCFSSACKGFLVDDATGFQFFFMGNGALVISNIFLSASLIILAERSVGCKDDDEEDCQGKVYGFKPTSLITIIATISGLLTAFLLPFIGAVIDFTRHRKLVGKCIVALIITFQAVQIYTVESTWFPMAILQALNGFFFQALELTAFSYLPEIKHAVGEAIMTTYSSCFYALSFLTQSLFILTVIAVSLKLSADDVLTAQIGQALDVIVTGCFYILAFYYFTPKNPKKELPNGSSLFVTGFKQVFVTARGIFKHYPTTLTRFLLAVTFAQSAVNAFTAVAVTFLIEVIDFRGHQTGLVFLVVIVSTMPGSLFATILTKKLNSPTLCMKICLAMFMIVNFVAFLTLKSPEVHHLVWPYSVLWGFMLGWFYPTEVSIYSSIMPKGQETELAGFYLYCTQVLAWLPPLVFTLMNENGIPLSWGGVHLNIYLFLALICYHLLPSWDQCVKIASDENKILNSASNDEMI